MNEETSLDKERKAKLAAKIKEYEQKGFYIVERNDEFSVWLERIGRDFNGFKEAVLVCIFLAGSFIYDGWRLVWHRDKESMKTGLITARNILKKAPRRVHLSIFYDGQVHETGEILVEKNRE